MPQDNPLQAARAQELEPDLPQRVLSGTAKRALAEAEERRRRTTKDEQQAPEIGGRRGPDPVRYGDWEVKGIASDF